MPLKLWLSPLSWNCLRVELVLAEKGITGFERTPEFFEKSIFGKVPLLEDDGVVIFESRAIGRYLCLKYPDLGPMLIADPSNPETEGTWEMRLILEAIEFNVHVGPVFAEKIIKPALNKTPDEAVLARHQPELENCLDLLNKVLSEIPFMGGQEYSLVDVFYMPGICGATKCVDVFGDRPFLKRWWDGVSARKAWATAVAPLDKSWGQVVPGWKSSIPNPPEEEGGEGNRAHL